MKSGLSFKNILKIPLESLRCSIFLIVVYDTIESITSSPDNNSAFIIYKFGSEGDQGWKSSSSTLRVISSFDFPLTVLTSFSSNSN